MIGHLMAAGHLDSLNVARQKRLILINGAPHSTGIFKQPVEGPREIGPEGLLDDRISDLSVHGGVDKAVYAYGTEDYAWWAGALGRDTEPGLFGENLTVSGLDPSHAVIGERWQVGSTLLEVSEPRQPCSKLAAKMGDPRFVRTFAKALRLGAYLRVIEPGSLQAGDDIDVVARPGHGVTIELVGRVSFGRHELAEKALEADALSGAWRELLEEKAARAR